MNRVGVTLVELLVAVAIAGLLLLALAGYMRASRNAQLAGEVGHEATLSLRLAADLLREQLLLAGSAPWPLPAAEDVQQLGAGHTPAQFLASGLQVTPVPGGHALGLVYLDDSLAGQPVARQYSFEAGVDGQGQPQLYRRSFASSRQPWVAGIERMVVAGFVAADGGSLGWQQAHGGRVRAVWLELHAQGQQLNVLLELPHRPGVATP